MPQILDFQDLDLVKYLIFKIWTFSSMEFSRFGLCEILNFPDFDYASNIKFSRFGLCKILNFPDFDYASNIKFSRFGPCQILNFQDLDFVK